MKRQRDVALDFLFLREAIFTDKSLLAHLLGYAYRSCSAIARTCKLFSVIVKNPIFWRYGIGRELSSRIPQNWTAVEKQRALKLFDPFYNGWPQEMPALERFSVHGDGLVWMFNALSPLQCAKYSPRQFTIHVKSLNKKQVLAWRMTDSAETYDIGLYYAEAKSIASTYGGVQHLAMIRPGQVSFIVSMRVNQPGGRVVPFWRSGLSSSGTSHWAGQVDAQGNPIQGFGIMTNIN
jgi:hypothetical protein